MTLSDHSLRQIDEESIESLSEDALRALAIKLLKDLKEARERLNRNSRNSSVPPGSEAPWEKGSKDSEDDEDDDTDALLDPEGLTESDCDSSEEEGDQGRPEETSQGQGNEKNEAVRKPGKQPGAQGFGRVETIPLHGHEHHHPDRCALCGQVFSEQIGTAYTAFDQLDIQWGDADRPGLLVINTRQVYYEVDCSCGHTTREAPCRQPEEALLEGVELSQWRLVGPGLAALIVCLFYRTRLSRQRIREFLQDWLGITLSVGTIHKVIHESGRAAMPVEEELVDALRQSVLAHVDETSWHERMQRLWLWVFVSANVIVYWIAHRTEELIKNVLGEKAYKGWLMSDGYTVYRQFLKRLRCWAHLVRKARGLAESLDQRTQAFGKKTLDLLHTLMDAVKDAREKPPDQPLSQLYREQLEEYRDSCERIEAAAPTKNARAFAVEMLNDWDVIFTVLDNPHLPLTNNEAERALRHCVILRKISYGTKTPQGSRIFAILASVIETCRLRGRSPWRYLEAVIAAGRAGSPVPPLPVAA